jgi:hypothetical protein
MNKGPVRWSKAWPDSCKACPLRALQGVKNCDNFFIKNSHVGHISCKCKTNALT